MPRHYLRGMGKHETGDPKVAVAYLRTSTDDQNLGPEAQRSAIQAWADRHGIRIASWHEDRISGGSPVEDRRGMLAAFAAVREHGAGLFVAGKRDRIARDVVVAATVERLAQDAGARVVTADGVSVEDTPEGALLRGLLDLFASYERAVIRSRTRAAMRVLKARGKQLGRPRKPTCPVFLTRVREMRQRGLSLARIAGILGAETGKKVHVTSLRRALAVAA